MIQPYTYTYSFFFRFFSHLGHHRTLSFKDLCWDNVYLMWPPINVAWVWENYDCISTILGATSQVAQWLGLWALNAGGLGSFPVEGTRSHRLQWKIPLATMKRPWCWERLKAGGEGDDRGWDGWMASQAQWTWVWAGSRRQWRTGKPGVLQSMGWESVRHDWLSNSSYYLNKNRFLKTSLTVILEELMG